MIGEIVTEIVGLDASARPVVARLHFWIDVLLELPIVTGVLVTGVWLTALAWPLTPLHVVKIVSALIAIFLNLYCIAGVVERYRSARDPDALARLGWHIRLSGIGIPFALFAAYLGLAYFRR